MGYDLIEECFEMVSVPSVEEIDRVLTEMGVPLKGGKEFSLEEIDEEEFDEDFGGEGYSDDEDVSEMELAFLLAELYWLKTEEAEKGDGRSVECLSVGGSGDKEDGGDEVEV